MSWFLILAGLSHVLVPAAIVLQSLTWRTGLIMLVAVHLGLIYGSLWPRSRLLGSNLLSICPEHHGGLRVYLTFDDGPDEEITPKVLDILNKTGARASFFVIGSKVEAHPELTRRIAAEGHSVENHSQSHLKRFSLLGPWRMNRQVEEAQHTIRLACGRDPAYFRAPAGLRSPWLGPILQARNLTLVTWTRRGFDAVSRSPDAILRRLTRNLRPGNILVLHDGGGAITPGGEPVVCQVLPRLLDHLQQQGLKPAALPLAEKTSR